MRVELTETTSVGILDVLGVVGVSAWIVLAVSGDFEQVASQSHLVQGVTTGRCLRDGGEHA